MDGFNSLTFFNAIRMIAAKVRHESKKIVGRDGEKKEIEEYVTLLLSRLSTLELSNTPDIIASELYAHLSKYSEFINDCDVDGFLESVTDLSAELGVKKNVSEINRLFEVTKMAISKSSDEVKQNIGDNIKKLWIQCIKFEMSRVKK